MGDDWIPDRPLTVHELLACLEVFEKQWLSLQERCNETTFTDEVPLRTLVHGRGVGGVEADRALQRVHQLLYPGALVAVPLTSST